MAGGLQGLRCRLFPAPSVRWLKAGNSPSAQTARLFTLHLLQSLYRKQSEACPCRPPALGQLPGASLCSSGFIAGAVLSRWAGRCRHRLFRYEEFWRREVLVAVGLQGLRCRLFPAPSVRWLKAGNSPSAQTARLFTLHLLQSFYRKQSEACPLQSPRLVRPTRVAFFFQAGLLPLQFCRAGREDAAIGVFKRRSFASGCKVLSCKSTKVAPRLMKKDPFRTSIVCTPAPDAERLGVHSGVLFMGSCFAGNVGQRMEEACFKVLVNPHGVLFNPFSVAAALEAFLENRQVGLGDLVERDGLWHSFQHHGSFSGPDAGKVVQDINAATLKGHSFLKEARCLVVTFGTAWVYALGEAHQVVANCHKFPARDFQRYRLSAQAVVERWQRLLVALRQENPDLQVIFTVSPVRHWKDGAHGNQLSKAVLLLAVEELVEQDGRNAYFPAYELMMDELRDYRFYADDMLHPSAQAVDFIWDRFSGAWLNEEALAFYRELQKLLTELRHRPLHPGALSFESFRKKTAQKIADLVKRYPNLDFSSLEALVRQ